MIQTLFNTNHLKRITSVVQPVKQTTVVIAFKNSGFFRLSLFYLLFLSSMPKSLAQVPAAELEALLTEPKIYTVPFAAAAPILDGNINETAWQQVPWSTDFIDIEGNKKPQPDYKTRIKMLWNDTCLFIAAELQEPHVWAKLQQHDQIIYQDNDFEIFIDPDNDNQLYYEIEVNARNTILDLLLNKPYRNAGGALIHWNVEKLKSAVQVQGTLNNPADTDKGWTVEMAIPFKSLAIWGQQIKPLEGSWWRINFSRVEWDTDITRNGYVKKKDNKGKTLPEHNWVWSPQGVINMHYPERWGYLQFTCRPAGSQLPVFALPYSEKLKSYLWLVYYRQKQYYEQHQEYTASLQKLGLPNKKRVIIGNQTSSLQLEALTHQFTATITAPDNTAWRINQDGLIQKIENKNL